MVLIKVMKRKDAASVFVAVVLAMIVMQVLTQVTGPIANMIVGRDTSILFPGLTWKETYLQPFIWAALQILVLELLIWVYVGLHQSTRKKR
jgi:hypothetical protein